MTELSCPLCGDKIIGRDEIMLSADFGEHLINAHMMTYLELDRQDVPEGRSTHVMGPIGSRTEKKIEEGKVPPEMMESGSPWESIICPLCANRVFGSEGDGLSRNLRHHFAEDHGIKAAHLVLPSLSQ